MSQVTISSTVIADWNYRYSDVELRVYALNDFITSDDKEIQRGNKTKIYQRVSCTVNLVIHTLTIASFTIDSTTDARQGANEARYFAYFYRATGKEIKLFDNLPDGFFLSPTYAGSSTYSWADVVAVNRISNPNTDFSAYNKAEIDRQLAAIIAQIGTVNNPIAHAGLVASLSTAQGALSLATDGLRGLYRGNGSSARSVTGFADVTDFGAKGDGVIIDDAAMTASSNVLTSASSTFTSADVGKLVDVSNVGALATLASPIEEVLSATQVRLSLKASHTVSGASFAIDGVTFTDGAMTAGGTTLTSATATFFADDVGKLITDLVGAGARNIVGTVLAFTTHTLTLSVSASVTATGRRALYGTDDRAAIQAALASGQRVYFPHGNYVVGSQMTIPASGMTLFGDGMWDSVVYSLGPIMNNAPVGFHLIRISGVNDTTVTDLGLSGTNWYGQTTTFGTSADGIYVGDSHAENIYHTRVRADSFWGIGLHVAGSGFPANVNYTNCITQLNSYDGFNPNVGPQGSLTIPTSLGGLSMIGCWAVRNGTGGLETSSSRITLIGNHFYYNAGIGASVGGYGDPTTCDTGAVIGNNFEFNRIGLGIASNQVGTACMGNTIRRNGFIGLLLQNDVVSTSGRNNQVTGNIISSNGRASYSGARFGISCDMPECLIQNNYVRDDNLTGYDQSIGIFITRAECRVWNNDVRGHSLQDYSFQAFTGNVYLENKYNDIVIFSDGTVTIVYPTSQFALIRGSFNPDSSNGTARFGIDVSTGDPIPMNNNEVSNLFGNANNFGGRFTVSEYQTFGRMAEFMTTQGAITKGMETGGGGTSFSTTVDTPSSINVYVVSGVLKIQNKTGSFIQLRVLSARLRAQNF